MVNEYGSLCHPEYFVESGKTFLQASLLTLVSGKFSQGYREADQWPAKLNPCSSQCLKQNRKGAAQLKSGFPQAAMTDENEQPLFFLKAISAVFASN